MIMIYILVLLIIYILICYIMFLFLCDSKMNKLFKNVVDKNIVESLKPYKKILDKSNEWIKSKNIKKLNIKSYDNLNLTSSFIKNEKEKYILVLVHGYRSTPIRDLYAGLRDYYDMGCSILLIDLRGCLSEGKYITFGYKESKDINSWIDYIHKNNKKTPIILGGISLGASSVLMTNNKNIKLMFIDSPYDDAYNEIKYVINHYFHLPGIIFMPMISLFFRLFIGTKLKKINVYNNLDKLNIPILMFHGLDDDFVPYNNTENIYKYYSNYKDKLLIPNATHGMGYLVDRNNYIKKIKEFINML